MGILWLEGTPPPDVAPGELWGLLSRREAREAAVAADTFAALWSLYLRKRFLYSAKLERLNPALATIQRGWPLLFQAEHDLFQLHAAWTPARGDTDESALAGALDKPPTERTAAEFERMPAAQPRTWDIASSLATFRDTDETYVIHHAVSQSARLMVDTILQCLYGINQDPKFRWNRMYYRHDNVWPTRVTQAIEAASPPEFTGRYSQAYLTFDHTLNSSVTSGHSVFDPSAKNWQEERSAATPGEAFWTKVGTVEASQSPTPSSSTPASTSIFRLRKMTIADIETAHQIVLAATGSQVVAGALGFSPSALLSPSVTTRADALRLSSLNRRFQANGLRRVRQCFVAEVNNQVVGVALQFLGAIPMNFSFLDTRVEIFAAADLEAVTRAAVVRTLARMAIQVAHEQGDIVTAALVDERDRAAVASSGFHDSGKSYESFVWQREDASGATAGPKGIQALYQHGAS